MRPLFRPLILGLALFSMVCAQTAKARADNLMPSSNIQFSNPQAGISFKTAPGNSNGICGTFVANGSTAVTVANNQVAVSDLIPVSLNTVGGTVGAIPHLATITAGTGFTVVGTASDTSTYNYCLFHQAN